MGTVALEQRLQAAEQRALEAEKKVSEAEHKVLIAEERAGAAEQKAQLAEEKSARAEQATQVALKRAAIAEENVMESERKLYEAENDLEELLVRDTERLSVTAQHGSDSGSLKILTSTCTSCNSLNGFFVSHDQQGSIQDLANELHDGSGGGDQLSITSL